jgi:formyltetrahydrofolate deformylase
MEFVAKLSCNDQPGIVNAVTSAILAVSGNILENQQFTDPTTTQFVMRTTFETNQSINQVSKEFTKSLNRFQVQLELFPADYRKRVLVFVSTESHCLRDLLYLTEIGDLPIEIIGVVSNHISLKNLVESANVNFIHIAENNQTELLKLISQKQPDLVVLARYMQILSNELCEHLKGKIINIHHSFLPGFKGAKPYHQAYERGVKIIGATAHFVTEDLDEGPIILQDISHVDHEYAPEELISVGRDIERRVLSKSVKLFSQNKIFLVGNKTIVF